MGEPTVEELEALGLYDPAEPHAPAKLELLRYLIELGASAQDLAAHRDGLPGLASVLAIRGGSSLTLAEAAARSGIDEAKLLELSRAAGFPAPGPEDRVFTPQFGDLAAGMAAAEGIFGEDAVLQLVRVMGSAMARIADAMVSAFLVNVEPGLSEDDPVGLDVARANARAAALLPMLPQALDVLLRQHLLPARRSSLGAAAERGYEKRPMCVGFVDLVGSTALALGITTAELGALLTQFEQVSSDVVTGAGGRVVKLIGDAVLFAHADQRAACEIALTLTQRLAAHPMIPPVRAGLAGGEVMLRDGDVFGPVVNLAARVAAAAEAGEVLAPAELAAAAALRSRPLPPRQLKGFAEPVELCLMLPTGSGR